jgi:hypothetical protein
LWNVTVRLVAPTGVTVTANPCGGWALNTGTVVETVPPAVAQSNLMPLSLEWLQVALDWPPTAHVTAYGGFGPAIAV